VRHEGDYAVHQAGSQERPGGIGTAVEQQVPDTAVVQGRRGLGRAGTGRLVLEAEDAPAVAVWYRLADGAVGSQHSVSVHAQQPGFLRADRQRLDSVVGDQVRPGDDRPTGLQAGEPLAEDDPRLPGQHIRLHLDVGPAQLRDAGTLGALALAAAGTAVTPLLTSAQGANPLLTLTYIPLLIFSGGSARCPGCPWLATLMSYLPAQPMIDAVTRALDGAGRARPGRARRLDAGRPARLGTVLPVGSAPAAARGTSRGG